MRSLIIALGSLGLLGLGTADAFAKGSASDSPPPPPAPVHHTASAPVAGPAVSSVPHNATGGSGQRNLSGTGSFRPVTASGKSQGQPTLVYPGVRNSVVRPTNGSNLNTIHNSTLKGGSKLRGQSALGVVKTKLDPQASARLRNWHGNVSNTAQAQANHAEHCRHHHDHDWWKHHCVAFIFFDWGWWAWDDGWWYPAWGYDPNSYYEYNQPIYGDIAPQQIVAGVQAKLQELGYYTYSIDGRMGPLTQAALARYQRDHHMNITSGVDPATLNSLGIVR